MTNYENMRTLDEEQLAEWILLEDIRVAKSALSGFDRKVTEQFMLEIGKNWEELVKEKLEWLNRECE